MIYTYRKTGVFSLADEDYLRIQKYRMMFFWSYVHRIPNLMFGGVMFKPTWKFVVSSLWTEWRAAH